MNKSDEKKLKAIESELKKRNFIDTGHLDGLLAQRALILLLNRPRLL